MKNNCPVSFALVCLFSTFILIVPVFAASPNVNPVRSQLDVLGDTVHVGNTYWELQQNGTVGKLISFAANPEDGSMTTNVWTYLPDHMNNFNRHVNYNRVFWTENGPEVFGNGNYPVDALSIAGYPTLSHIPGWYTPLVAYHAYPYGADYDDSASITMGYEWQIYRGMFSNQYFTSPDDIEAIWPRIAYGEYGGVDYIHMLSIEHLRYYEEGDTYSVYYSRNALDGEEQGIVSGDWQTVTNLAHNHSASIAVSESGNRVAVASNIWRQGEHYSTLDNDLYLWISEDGGTTWDWENPINITDFKVAYLMQDSLRTFNDLDVYFDQNDVLHLAFTVIGYPCNSGGKSLIYHWDEVTNHYSLVADGWFYNYAIGASIHAFACRPSLLQDPDTGTLYCIWMQAGLPGEYTMINDSTFQAWDASEYGYANYEIMVSASPGMQDWQAVVPGGLWTKPIDLTNTRAGEGEYPDGVPAGACESEFDPSVARETDGEYMFLSYMLDKDAGIVSDGQGTYTINPIVVHRVPFAQIMDAVYDSAGWVRNYPLHYDSAGFYYDMNLWRWNNNNRYYDPFYRTLAVQEGPSLTPNQFVLAQNYPNPFNPETAIRFSLETQGQVKLAVFDLLGREVQVLSDRVLAAGEHTLLFDASDLPSGIYFARLSSGNASQVIRMTLLK